MVTVSQRLDYNHRLVMINCTADSYDDDVKALLKSVKSVAKDCYTMQQSLAPLKDPLASFKNSLTMFQVHSNLTVDFSSLNTNSIKL